MKGYFGKRRAQRLSGPERSRVLRELQELLNLEKNNVVFDLRSAHTPIWLICPNELSREKNIFANAQIIAVQGTVYLVQAEGIKRTSL